MRPPFSFLPRKTISRRFAAAAIAWHGTCSLKEVSRIEAASAASHKRVTRRSSHANHVQSPDRRRRPRLRGRAWAQEPSKPVDAPPTPVAAQPAPDASQAAPAVPNPEALAPAQLAPLPKDAPAATEVQPAPPAPAPAPEAVSAPPAQQAAPAAPAAPSKTVNKAEKTAQASRVDGQAACVHRAGAAGIEPGQRRDRGLRRRGLGCRPDAAVGGNDFPRSGRCACARSRPARRRRRGGRAGARSAHQLHAASRRRPSARSGRHHHHAGAPSSRRQRLHRRSRPADDLHAPARRDAALADDGEPFVNVKTLGASRARTLSCAGVDGPGAAFG